MGSLHAATPKTSPDQATRFKIKKEKLAAVLLGIGKACGSGASLAGAKNSNEKQEAALHLVGDVFNIAGIIASKQQQAGQQAIQQPIIVVQMPAQQPVDVAAAQQKQEIATRLASLFDHTRMLDGGQNLPQYPALAPFQNMPAPQLPAAFGQCCAQPGTSTSTFVQQLFSFCQQTMQQQVVQTFSTCTHDLDESYNDAGEETQSPATVTATTTTTATSTTTNTTTSHILQLYASELLTQTTHTQQTETMRTSTPLSAELATRIETELHNYFATLAQDTLSYLK